MSPNDKRARAVALCWERGFLRHRLRKHQRPIYEDIKAKLWGGDDYTAGTGTERRYILKCHRRFGKSALIAFLFCELAQQKPGARLYWAAETSKQVRNIILPNMRMALEDCPEELRPRWKAADMMWVWPNGSELMLAGCEDEFKADRLRGDGADGFAIDEAGSIGPLQYVYRSIALWMVADRGGRIIMPSSPAKSPGHPFTEFCAQAEAGQGGGYSCRTVYDSEWTPELVDELATECGGIHTTDFQREALCMDVVDRDKAIVPEFTPRAMDPWRVDDHGEVVVVRPPATGDDVRPPLVREYERPDYFDIYTGMDLGFSPDFTAVGFGYYDFKNATLVIEGEAQLERMRTDQLASAITAGEARWSDYWDRLGTERYMHDEDRTPYGRVSDVDLRTLADLRGLHDLHFTPTAKDNLHAQVNNLRIWVEQGRIAINPRCVHLISHMKAGIWNGRHNEFARMGGFGHFDFVAMLVYLVRYVRAHESHNPYPSRAAGVNHDTHHINSRPVDEDPNLAALANRLTRR